MIQKEECDAAPMMMAKAKPVQDVMVDGCVDEFVQLKKENKKEDMDKLIKSLAHESIMMDGYGMESADL